MKTFKSFAFAVALAGLTLPMAGCSDDDTAPKGEDVERGDKACRIETFTLNFSDGTTLSGDVYDYDKSVDLSYTTAEFEMMKSATATLTLSEGATVSPDPSQTADYTQPLSFTVTAKDGKTARTYTTKPVEKVLEGYTKVEAATSKTATEMGIGTAADYKFVGVSGDKLVVGKKVFDYKTFAPAGDLNMTGYEDQKMTGMANDEAGHLIAAVNADGASAVPTTIICWKDGWDKAPSEYIKSETSFIGKQISASGNLLEGAGIVSAMNGTGPKGAHFAWARLDGPQQHQPDFDSRRSSFRQRGTRLGQPDAGFRTRIHIQRHGLRRIYHDRMARNLRRNRGQQRRIPAQPQRRHHPCLSHRFGADPADHLRI